MEYLPIFLQLRGQRALVVGGGGIAARKVDLLLRAGADVTVVAPRICAELEQRHARGELRYLDRAFAPGDLSGCCLAVAATDRLEVNEAVSQEARRVGVQVNVVDAPQLCTFIMPSIVDRSPLIIAVSSGGRVPVLARLLRERLEGFIPSGYGRLARLAGEFRGEVKACLTNITRRRRFWEEAFRGPVAERAMAGCEEDARTLLREQLKRCAANQGDELGEVYLVGAGPGDPDLLTFKALRLMQQADAVVYDRLVAPAILDRVRRDAERVYVGKSRGNHTLPQEQINELLVSMARKGMRVLRLKGGDPFVFGRGGEEIDTLKEAGIPFQVVPGITAALGCASYAGIPLTHRDYAQACLFVTGHLHDGGLELPWSTLVQPRQTVVVYMGVGGLQELCNGLVAHGLPKSWPAALVEQGTTENQRVIAGTLDSLPAQAAAAHVQPPSLVILGEVVRLRDRLSWRSDEVLSVDQRRAAG